MNKFQVVFESCLDLQKVSSYSDIPLKVVISKLNLEIIETLLDFRPVVIRKKTHVSVHGWMTAKYISWRKLLKKLLSIGRYRLQCPDSNWKKSGPQWGRMLGRFLQRKTEKRICRCCSWPWNNRQVGKQDPFTASWATSIGLATLKRGTRLLLSPLFMDYRHVIQITFFWTSEEYIKSI